MITKFLICRVCMNRKCLLHEGVKQHKTQLLLQQVCSHCIFIFVASLFRVRQKVAKNIVFNIARILPLHLHFLASLFRVRQQCMQHRIGRATNNSLPCRSCRFSDRGDGSREFTELDIVEVDTLNPFWFGRKQPINNTISSSEYRGAKKSRDSINNNIGVNALQQLNVLCPYNEIMRGEFFNQI